MRRAAAVAATLALTLTASAAAYSPHTPPGLTPGAQAVWDLQTAGGDSGGSYAELVATAADVRQRLIAHR